MTWQSYTAVGNDTDGTSIVARRLGPDLLPPTVTQSREAEGPVRVTSEGVDLETLVADYERSLLREALVQSKGVKKQAARLLGISFRSFRYRLEKLSLEDAPWDD